MREEPVPVEKIKKNMKKCKKIIVISLLLTCFVIISKLFFHPFPSFDLVLTFSFVSFLPAYMGFLYLFIFGRYIEGKK